MPCRAEERSQERSALGSSVQQLAASRCSLHDARNTVSSPSLVRDRTVPALCTIPVTACKLKPQVRPTKLAPLAQSAERLHGKEKVYGSIP